MARRVEYCDKCKADREIRSFEEDPLDKDRKLIKLVCGHTFGKMVKVANKDTVGISDEPSWLILKDPVAEYPKSSQYWRLLQDRVIRLRRFRILWNAKFGLEFREDWQPTS